MTLTFYLLAKFWLAAVTSPVLVAKKAKSDDFGHCPDLDLACDLKRLKQTLKSTRRELLIVLSPASLRPSVRELGRGGGEESPTPSGARSAEYPCGARFNEGWKFT